MQLKWRSLGTERKQQPPCAPAVNLISLYMPILLWTTLKSQLRNHFYKLFHYNPQRHAEMKKRIFRTRFNNANHQQEKKPRHCIGSPFLSVVLHPTCCLPPVVSTHCFLWQSSRIKRKHLFKKKTSLASSLRQWAAINFVLQLQWQN